MFKALYIMNRILKSVRALIGSQWSVCNTGMMCSCFFAPATSLAAAFCTCCSLFISLWGSPVRTPLHYTSLVYRRYKRMHKSGTSFLVQMSPDFADVSYCVP